MIVTEQDLQQWLDLSEKASPGPWERQRMPGATGYEHDSAMFSVANDCEEQVADCSDNTRWNDLQIEANAAFIAASRTAIPALIAEVKRLRSYAASGLGPLLSEVERLSNVYAVAASLRTFPVPFDDHLRLVDAVDAAHADARRAEEQP